MKKQHLYSCLTLAALMGFWSCTSSRQTAQNAGDADDLYGSSGNAEVYASNRPLDNYSNSRSGRQQQRALRNANPDYNDEQQGYDANTDEYYSELSTRKLNRGLSADPGWNDVGTGTNAYTSGFSNGYNSAMTSAYSWNRWGFNNTGFYSGLGLGMGLGSFGFGGSPFYSPFGYGGFGGYSPFASPFGYGGYGNGFYDPFYSSYAYGGFGGYSPFYSPFGYGGGYGGYYGGGAAYVNNPYVAGADPYRSNRTSGPRFNNGNNSTIVRGYNNNFTNTPRSGNAPSGGRSGYASGNASSNGYYATPRSNSRGSYYYDNGSSAGGRAGANSATTNNTAPSYNSSRGSNNGYYAAPRSNSRGTYSPADGYSGGRSSYQQSQPSYQQPSYQNQNRSFSQPSYSQPSYSAPSRSFSAPSGGGGGGGGFSGGGGHSGGGGGRGPR